MIGKDSPARHAGSHRLSLTCLLACRRRHLDFGHLDTFRSIKKAAIPLLFACFFLPSLHCLLHYFDNLKHTLSSHLPTPLTPQYAFYLPFFCLTSPLFFILLSQPQTLFLKPSLTSTTHTPQQQQQQQHAFRTLLFPITPPQEACRSSVPFFNLPPGRRSRP